MDIARSFSSPWGLALTWTLLHFLWQGTILVVLLTAGTQLFGVRSLATRYRLSLATLVLMAICPLVTFRLVLHEDLPEPIASRHSHAINAPLMARAPESPDASLPRAALETPAGGYAAVFLRMPVSVLAQWQPYLLAGWVIGVGLLGLRLMVGVTMARRLRRGHQPLDEAWTDRAGRLGARMGLRRVRIFVSERVHQSLVTGLWRPMILVPTAWMIQMTPEMLEGVLAHELAHVRRLDMWTIVLQRLVETFLFYHPAVWWLSCRLNRDREMCCDEMAVAATGDRLQFTKALQWAARGAVAADPVLTAAWKGSQNMVVERIRRLLGVASPRERVSFWPLALILPLVPAVLALSTIGHWPQVTAAAAEPHVGYGQSVSAVSNPPPKPEQPAASQAGAHMLKPHPTAGSFVGPDGYRIEPPDILELEVREVASSPARRKESSDPAELTGRYPVGPDGNVYLRRYGSVSVAGKTMAEARRAIEEQLRRHFDSPVVWLDVVAYNSKVAYLVLSGKNGDCIHRLPVNNSSTVASAILQVEGAAARAAKGRVWLARPARDASSVRDEIKEIDWHAIVQRGAVEANLPLTPGDRIFIGSPGPK